MIARWTIRSVTLAMALAVVTATSRADDSKTPANPKDFVKAMVEAGKPGPAHKKLQPLAGSWTYTCKCWMQPGTSPTTMSGTIDRKWILGGRFLQETVVGRPGFEGFGLLGYDNATKKYTMTWVCKMGTGVSSGIGVVEAPGTFVFQSTCSCPLMKKEIRGRDIVRIETPDRVVMEAYKIVDGKEIKAMEIVSVRKK